MKLTPNQEAILAVRREIRILNAYHEDLVQAVQQEGCEHPSTVTYEWEHDNGYGRQTMITGLHCVLCRARTPYAALASPPWERQ